MSKEKQIEEMAHIVSNAIITWVYEAPPTSNPHFVAAAIYDAGYRKQSDGEWIKDNTSKFEHRYNCSVCNYRFFGIPTPYCPNCGAKMKGGE